jgi:hypothetical protein
VFSLFVTLQTYAAIRSMINRELLLKTRLSGGIDPSGELAAQPD